MADTIRSSPILFWVYPLTHICEDSSSWVEPLTDAWSTASSDVAIGRWDGIRKKGRTASPTGLIRDPEDSLAPEGFQVQEASHRASWADHSGSYSLNREQYFPGGSPLQYPLWVFMPDSRHLCQHEDAFNGILISYYPSPCHPLNWPPF